MKVTVYRKNDINVKNNNNKGQHARAKRNNSNS